MATGTRESDDGQEFFLPGALGRANGMKPLGLPDLDSLPPAQQQEVMDRVLGHLIRRELKRQASRRDKSKEQSASAKPYIPLLQFKNGPDIEAYRKSLGLSQTAFWSKVGITQSGGSRYEANGREIPKPVRMLLELAYGGDEHASRLLEWMRARSSADAS